MSGYSSKLHKWHKNCSHSNVEKLGDKKADFSTKFQPYPTDHQRQVNFAKLPGNV